MWKPSSWELHLEDAVKGWNHIAGRRLFEVVKERDRAEITLHDPRGLADYPGGEYTVMIGADGLFTKTEPYVRCEVYTQYLNEHKYPVTVAAHEMGHCLGFKHRRVGIMGQGWFAPRPDRRMLKRAGYI